MMKLRLSCITVMLILCSNIVFSQAFTAGNVVVYRYGDGAAPMPLGTLVPVFLDEYTPTGTLVTSKIIPATTSGTNYRLTGLGRLGTGLYQQEGMSTLSPDGKYISIFGYNEAPGNGVPVTTDGLVVGLIAADGSYNSTTTISNFPATGLGAPRSAITNGTGIWVNGYQNGVHYTTLGSASTSARVSAGQNSPRTITIFNDTIYAPIGSSNTLAKYSPVPTGSVTFLTQTLPALPGPVNITSNQVAVFTVGTRTRMYIADDGAATGNTIRRYYLNTAGTVWVADGTVTATPQTSFVKGITGVASVVGSNTVIDLYATTWGNDGNGTETSKLLKFTDTYVTASPASPPSTSALITLATAPSNTVFRSATMAPAGSAGIGTIVLPLSLKSFNAGSDGKNVNLWWSTYNELNVHNFIIERSDDAVNFNAIGSRNAVNSGQLNAYSFIDGSAKSNIIFYRLKIVDKDGSYTYSQVIRIKNNADQDYALSIAPNPVAANSVNVTHAKAGAEAFIKIISEQGIVMQVNKIQMGATQTLLLLNTVAQGNYVIEFANENSRQTVKMIKL